MKRLRAFNKFYRRYEVDLWGRACLQRANKTVRFLKKVQTEKIRFSRNPGRSFGVRKNKFKHITNTYLRKKLIVSFQNIKNITKNNAFDISVKALFSYKYSIKNLLYRFSQKILARKLNNNKQKKRFDFKKNKVLAKTLIQCVLLTNIANKNKTN